MEDNSNTETKKRGNPVIPDAPVPSMVKMSMVPEPPTPTPKVIEEQEVEVVDAPTPIPVEEPVSDGEMDAKPKGIIVIKVFENSPYEVEFDGRITGSEIDIAWKSMMKEYRVWKHNVFKKETDSKTESGGV